MDLFVRERKCKPRVDVHDRHDGVMVQPAVVDPLLGEACIQLPDDLRVGVRGKGMMLEPTPHVTAAEVVTRVASKYPMMQPASSAIEPAAPMSRERRTTSAHRSGSAKRRGSSGSVTCSRRCRSASSRPATATSPASNGLICTRTTVRGGRVVPVQRPG